MTTEPEVPPDQGFGFPAFKELLPWISLAVAGCTIFWGFSSNLAIMKEDAVQQQKEIEQITEDQATQHGIEDTISVQLAQLQQSVADIKANLQTK